VRQRSLGKGGRLVVGKIENHNPRDITVLRSYGMVSDLDVWRAANPLIRQHGAEAELEAARLHDLMLERGDEEGRLTWLRIRRAIEALREAPPPGKAN
jgi:hypothetical protein